MIDNPTTSNNRQMAMGVFKLFDLQGKTALVTGAGRGLGQAMASALAQAGASVAIFDINEADAESTVQLIKKFDGKAISARIDITNSQQVQLGIKHTIEQFGKIDVLVNNAGVTSRSPFEELDETEWERVMAVNLGGVYRCSRFIAQHMIEQKILGSIINIASISGFVGNRGGLNSHYCASKGGVIALTRSLAVEWAPYRIRVNALAPGYFVTPMTDRLKKINPDFYNELVSRIPLGRFGEVSDLTGAIIYLASDASIFITGHALVIDGGYTAW